MIMTQTDQAIADLALRPDLVLQAAVVLRAAVVLVDHWVQEVM